MAKCTEADALNGKRLGFIGFGFMAQNLCRGFFYKKILEADQITCYDVNQSILQQVVAEKFEGIHISASNLDLINSSDIIVIAVKPNIALRLLAGLKEAVVTSRHLFVSICAGISTRQIEDVLPTNTRIVRTMPNSSVAVGYGVTVTSGGRWALPEDLRITCRLFESVGICLELPEKDLNTVTAISGSGPAYVYTGIDAAGDGGSMLGLPRDVAQKLAAHTLIGAAKMFLETGQHPSALKDSVCSPGGTTLAGLFALEKGGMRALIMETIKSAHDRAKELEELARRGSNI
ncbi:hypothetical protein HELRODRAFT_186252 [Helobdella robusta]|uniref:Pyrroline-5-carboxylate reductase n=1 Tax=Helobdella robusta TaxID=6412 RepID=T1FNV4_HELRO|nr:hypothetical protein HELRODRAFT_186252 [Helobdella robusta]ESO11456.1 hypothetical protein HELRODRAFT_186252 [Helobdella robusta]